jgi:hypothetical protein
MAPQTKLSVVTAELENAGKIIEEHLRADASRVPDLDVALVSTGGWAYLQISLPRVAHRVICSQVQIHHQLLIRMLFQTLGCLLSVGKQSNCLQPFSTSWLAYLAHVGWVCYQKFIALILQ